MSKVTLDAYLFFRGNCAEAMEFYKGIFGGEIYTMSYEQAMGDKTPQENKGTLMHASLKGGEIDLLASDTSKASEKAAKISLSLSGDDEEKLTEMFNRLSEGGDVFSPLQKEIWGDVFGSVTDKYGIEWMVNISATKQ